MKEPINKQPPIEVLNLKKHCLHRTSNQVQCKFILSMTEPFTHSLSFPHTRYNSNCCWIFAQNISSIEKSAIFRETSRSFLSLLNVLINLLSYDRRSKSFSGDERLVIFIGYVYYIFLMFPIIIVYVFYFLRKST